MKGDLKKNEAEENQEKRSSTLVRLTKWRKRKRSSLKWAAYGENRLHPGH